MKLRVVRVKFDTGVVPKASAEAHGRASLLDTIRSMYPREDSISIYADRSLFVRGSLTAVAVSVVNDEGKSCRAQRHINRLIVLPGRSVLHLNTAVFKSGAGTIPLRPPSSLHKSGNRGYDYTFHQAR